MGGIDQIFDYRAHLMRRRIAVTSMILTMAGVFAVLIEENRPPGLARRAILYASCMVSFILNALSLHFHDTDTMDMVFGNHPSSRVALNWLALTLAIVGIARPLKGPK